MAKKTNEILLIDEENLKLWSPISQNVSVNKILPFVQQAQRMYILPTLGSALYNTLTDAIDTDTLTDEQKALLLEIAPPLAFYATFLGLRPLAYSITEKGITKEKSDNSESLSEKELGEWKIELKHQADDLLDDLLRYLCNCRDLYEWQPANECDCSKFLQNEDGEKKKFDSLIYFPNKKKSCNCK